MRQARQEYTPPVPPNLHQLAAFLPEYSPMDGFYQGSKTATDNSVVLVFATKLMIKALKRVTKFFVDGTFEVGNFTLS